jgi:copper(I)-binding protein
MRHIRPATSQRLLRRLAFLTLATDLVLTVLQRRARAIASDAPMGMPIDVRDAWVRWLPGNLPAAGYLTVANNTARQASPDLSHSPLYRLRAL